MENKEEKYIDIMPISKWKRILTYLADFFLNFIMSLLLFTFLVAPVGKNVTGFETLNAKHEELTTEMYSLFYKNELVFKSDNYPEYDLIDNIDYSFNNFLSYYVVSSDIKNENIYHYFNDIKNNKNQYSALFNQYDNNRYFDIDVLSPTGFTLKNNVKEQLDGYFIVNGSVSPLGEEYYSDIKTSLYLPLFAEIMASIQENDLVYDGVSHSYLYCKEELANLEEYHEALLSICAITSYLISSSIYYFFIPSITDNKKTLAMIFMKVERINFNDYKLIKTKQYCFSALFNFLLNASFIMFLPMTLVSVGILFTYKVMFIISAISFVFNIVGLCFVLFNEYNKSWNDTLNSIVYISNDSLASIYKSRGYNV